MRQPGSGVVANFRLPPGAPEEVLAPQERNEHVATRYAEHRRVYDCRHTFASWAVRAGVPTFYLTRVMGTSLAMIDRAYGHPVPDSDAYVRGLLDAADEAFGQRAGSGPLRNAAPSQSGNAVTVRLSRVLPTRSSPWGTTILHFGCFCGSI
jgi:hypothetical protein